MLPILLPMRSPWGRVARGVAALGLALACGAPSPPPPNLLLVTVDTLRPDRLACYGGDEAVGTAICDVATRGSLYVWAFATAPATAPSLASLLTSRLPSEHGVTELASSHLRENVASVVELLREAGYDTAAFVSNPVVRRGRGLERGFAIYDDHMTRRERNRPGLREREAEATTRAALAWAQVSRPPWFLWVHYQDPHGPYEPPGAGRRRDASESTRLSLLQDHSGRGGIPAYQELPGLRSVEAYERRYRDEIRYLDLHLGLLVKGLDELGDPPWVILTADHGEAFGEDDYWFAHGHSLGLDQIRVPLLVRPGGADPGATARRVTAPVSVVDVAPTLLAAAGLEAPAGFIGRPLQEAAVPGRALFAEHRLRGAVVSGDTYFARDREGFDAPVPDAVSGGRLHPLPARSAVLPAEGPAGAYREATGETTDDGPTRVLAELLGARLASLPEAAPRPDGAAPTEAEREALRALGYLE